MSVGECRLGQDDRELVAADPARDVGSANSALDALGGNRQHLVAREMARRVSLTCLKSSRSMMINDSARS